MSTKINKVALPGIPNSKWDICQYNELNYLPEVGSTPAYPGMVCPIGSDLYLSGYFGENMDVLAWTRLDLNTGETARIANLQTFYRSSSTGSINLTFTNNSNFSEVGQVWLPLGKRNSYAVNLSGGTSELAFIWDLIKCLALITYHAGYSTTTGSFNNLREQAFNYVDAGRLNEMPMPYIYANSSYLSSPCEKITYGVEACRAATATDGAEYIDLHFGMSFGYLILRAYRNNINFRLGFEIAPCVSESMDGLDIYGLNSASKGAIDSSLVGYAYYTSRPNKSMYRFLRKDLDLHTVYNLTHMAARTPQQFWWCHPLLSQGVYGTGYQVASCKRFLRINLFDEVLNTIMLAPSNSDRYYTMSPLFDEIVRTSRDQKNALVEYVIDGDFVINDSTYVPHNELTNPVTYPSEYLYQYRVGSTSTTTTTTTTTPTTGPTVPTVNYHVSVLNHYGDPLSSDEQSMCSATMYDTYGRQIRTVQCDSTSSLHFYQVGGTTIPSYIIVTYRSMSKTISNLNTATSSTYIADFSGNIEFVRQTANLIPYVTYQGQEVRTYQIGQYADYNFDEIDWQNRFTTDGMEVYDYDNVSKTNGVDSFVVYEKHPNKVFVIPSGVTGMAASYGPITIPETAGDGVRIMIELEQEQSFAPDLP